MNNKIVVITPNPTRELEWTGDLFDEFIRARFYIFRWGKAPSSMKSMRANTCKFKHYTEYKIIGPTL